MAETDKKISQFDIREAGDITGDEYIPFADDGLNGRFTVESLMTKANPPMESGLGTATDRTMTQRAITEALEGESSAREAADAAESQARVQADAAEAGVRAEADAELQGMIEQQSVMNDVVRFHEVADCSMKPAGWPTVQATGINKESTDFGASVVWVATRGEFLLYTDNKYYSAWKDSARFNPLRKHCAYICEADKCVYMWLNGELTPVGKNYDAEIADALSRLEETSHPVEVAQNESTDDVIPDLSVADENGNVLAAFANGHIYTKNFRSDAIGTNHPVDVVNADDAELSIGDESGNDIVHFSGGHIRTKNFSSKSVTKDVAKLKNPDVSLVETEEDAAELSIGDAEGNDIVRFNGGHIKTKNFNSKAVVKAIADMADVDVTVEEADDAELSIGDAEGNDIMRIDRGHIKTKNFNSRDVARMKPWFDGKTLIVTGDSIPHGQTMGGAVATPYPEIIANKLGMVVNNYAIGGSTFAQHADFGGAFKDLAAFNAATKDTSKVYMYMTKDGRHKPTDNPMVYMRYNGSSWVAVSGPYRSPISARYQFMTDDADVIFVACGTNDFQYDWTNVGTMFVDNSANEPTEVNKDVHTYYGAINATIEGLLAKYFGKLIVFATPIKRCQTQGIGGDYGLVTSKNTKGLTLKEYGDIIKECCAYYSIPVIDLYSESGLNPHLASQSALFDSYKTHPLQAGHDILGSLIAAKLLTLKK